MRLIEALKLRKYAAISVISTIVFTLVYIYTQVLGIVQNIDLWFTVIPWYNAILFITFAILFGVTLSFQIYIRKQPKVCTADNKIKGAGISSSATFLGFLVAQCPACASIGALFLPASIIVGFFTRFSALINIISIGLLLFTLNYLGAFKKYSR